MPKLAVLLQHHPGVQQENKTVFLVHNVNEEDKKGYDFLFFSINAVEHHP